MIDTQAKRYSMLNFADSSPVMFEPPSGMVSRSTMLGLYSGIALTEPVEPTGIVCPGLIDITDNLGVVTIC